MRCILLQISNHMLIVLNFITELRKYEDIKDIEIETNMLHSLKPEKYLKIYFNTFSEFCLEVCLFKYLKGWKCFMAILH